MILATLISFFGVIVLFVDGIPTLGDGYGHVGGAAFGEGHGHNQKVVGGAVGGADKHGVQSHAQARKGSAVHGEGYGDDRLFNKFYRGQQDVRRDHSDRNRALHNRNHHRQAGDSYRNKGKTDDGFHNVYHKEEYSKNKKFFDTDRDNQYKQHYNDNGQYYGDVDSRLYSDAVDGEKAVKVGGQRGDAYGREFYDRGEADYATKNFGKQHADHGKHYGSQHGNQHEYGNQYGHGHGGYGHGHGGYGHGHGGYGHGRGGYGHEEAQFY